ncbi:hypothetical protein AAHB37_06045 [Glutamicibacter halophytocola]|uniref:hypothetical protein n=1 Tax=Glutamicibacter halophytocola TaxID=1933880 RepID=UPI00321BC571
MLSKSGLSFRLAPPSAQTRPHMAGDELCANACMSLAALHAATSTERGELILRIETSGAEQPLHSTAQRLEAGYRCQLQLPLPQRIEPYPLSGAAGPRISPVSRRCAPDHRMPSIGSR